jgi:hypothetical protein
LSIKPNPFTEESIISINGNNNNEKYTLFLYDLTGKLIKTINIIENEILNRDNLESGIYYLVLKSNKSTICQKIIIF